MERLAGLFLGSEARHHPASTPADLKELQRTARLLRSELDQVIEDEVAGDEACEVVTDNIISLRVLAAERRRERDVLKKHADDAELDCHAVQEACRCEEQKLSLLRENITWLRDDTSRAAADIIKTRKETQQIKYTLETSLSETAFRLRADKQNLQTECEIEEIRVRELTSQRSIMQQNLESKQQQLDQIQSNVATLCKELDEEATKQEMYQNRHQFLIEQLESMGGKIPKDNVFSSVQQLFTKMVTKESNQIQNNHLAPTMIVRRHTVHNSSHQSNHPVLTSSPSLTNLHNSQQQTHSSFATDKLLREPTYIHQVGASPNELHPGNNVYKIGHQYQDITIPCGDDNDTIVSALTLDEKEFQSLSSG